MSGNLFRKKIKKEAKPFIPSKPLTWWIDDLSHEVCGLIDDPRRGLKNMPWPDCEKVYLAVDKREYDKLKEALEIANEAIGFYTNVTNNPKQYMRQGYIVYNLKKEIFIDGGEKAREAQKQIKEVMESR